MRETFDSPEFIASLATPIQQRLTRYRQDMLRAVFAGLRSTPKYLRLPLTLDTRSLELQEALDLTVEHYAGRLEGQLLRLHADSVGDIAGDNLRLVELGCGTTVNARILLAALRTPLVYMPVDYSSPRLWSTAMQMQLDYPLLAVRPLVGDFTMLGALPDDMPGDGTLALAFRSLLGEVDPVTATRTLKRLGGISPRSLVLCDIDLLTAPEIMEGASNDAGGIAADLNKHVLTRINRELGGDFDPSAFSHVVTYNAVCGRLEQRLKSRKRQTVRIGGEAVAFERGELILTRNSQKYTVGQMQKIARRAGLVSLKVWTDPERRFGLFLFGNRGALH